MKHRTTHALLVVVALLLALNLAAALPWPTAQAQDEVQLWPPPQPRLVGMTTPSVMSSHNITGPVVHRMWSDGVVEWRRLRGPTWWDHRTPEWQEVVPQP